MVPIVGYIYTHLSTTAVSPFLYCFTISWWVGWIASYVFIFTFWSRCCCCCCVLLLLPTTSALKRREVSPTVSSFSVSATTTAVTFASILLLLLLLRRDKHFSFVRGAADNHFLVGCADAAAGACATYNISTEAERGAGYCFFYVSALYTAIFRLWLLTALLLRRDACWKNTKWLHTCSATRKGDIYVPGTYTKFSFSFSV